MTRYARREGLTRYARREGLGLVPLLPPFGGGPAQASSPPYYSAQPEPPEQHGFFWGITGLTNMVVVGALGFFLLVVLASRR